MPEPSPHRRSERALHVAVLRALYAAKRLRPCLGRHAVAAFVREVAAEARAERSCG